MKLVRTVLEVDVYGEKITLRRPNYKEAQAYRDSLKKIGEESDATDLVMEFLETLGMPKEVFLRLELAHVNQIMEVIAGVEKK